MESAKAARIAYETLDAIGGRPNIVRNAMCMTRLRLTLCDLSQVDFERLLHMPNVLGVAPYGQTGIEVVFGPAVIDDVFHHFVRLTGLHGDARTYRDESAVAASRRAGHTAQHPVAETGVVRDESEQPEGLDPEDARWLRQIVGLDEDSEKPEGTA